MTQTDRLHLYVVEIGWIWNGPEERNLRSLDSPADQQRPDGEACPNGGDEQQAALFQPAVVHGVVEGQRDGGRGGVAVVRDVDDHLLDGELEPLGGREDDPA